MENDNLREKFTELLFDETETANKAEVWRELALDEELAADFELSKASLSLFAKASEIDQPRENYWAHFERDLQNTIRSEAVLLQTANQSKPSLLQSLRAFFTSSVRVPVPAFVLSMLIFGVAGYSALRPFSATNSSAVPQVAETVQPLPQPTNILNAETVTPAPIVIEKIVEKPVIREKIVKQKVFIKGDSRKNNEDVKQTRVSNETVGRDARPRREAENPTLNLSAFTPPEKLDVKIVKDISDAK